MSLIEDIDEILELDRRKRADLDRVPLERTKRCSNYSRVMDLEESLYRKMRNKDIVRSVYNIDITQIYNKINKNLSKDKQLFNPFTKRKEV